MKIHNNQLNFDLEEQDEVLSAVHRVKNLPAHSGKSLRTAHRRSTPAPEILAMLEQGDDQTELKFTYQAARHEQAWLKKYLGGFFEAHWLTDVLKLVTGGKEANVYLCEGHTSTEVNILAAKVYRPRQFRNLRKDHIYREGRQDLDSSGNMIKNHGMLRSIEKKSTLGLELSHISWLEHEYLALQKLHSIGVDVPKPFTRGDNAILMEYIGDKQMAAQTLNSVELSYQEAHELYQRVLYNIESMLSLDIIHGDLSAYNILYWHGKITMIDFPQMVNPHQNVNAWRIFERDVLKICEYFARMGIRSKPGKIASSMWTARNYRISPALDPKFLDEEDKQDRKHWEQFVRKEALTQG
jgi:RIO kinase 1